MTTATSRRDASPSKEATMWQHGMSDPMGQTLTEATDEYGDTVLIDETGQEWGIMPGEALQDAIARINHERLYPID